MKKRKADPVISNDKAKQAIKVMTVILRDHSYMTYHDASLAFAYCWKHTETEEAAKEREESGKNKRYGG